MTYTMPPSQLGLPLNDIVTPSLIVDKEKLKRNCERILDFCKEMKLDLRAQTKTHKTIEGVDFQTGGTRRKLVCSTLAECEFYSDNGCEDILYGFPLAPHHMARITKLTSKLDSFHVLIDSQFMVDCLLKTQPPENKLWSVFLKVDCGYMRAGILWNSEEGKTLAKLLVSSDKTQFSGVYVHCGDSYTATASGVEGVRDRTIERLLDFVNNLKADGVNCPVFGIGSTPTCSNPGQLMGRINEIHPGNYIFYDVQQTTLNSCCTDDIAVCVATRIVGHYPEKKKMLIDCGFTALTKQGFGEMKSGYAVVRGEPNLRLASMTQELGQIEAIEGVINYDKYPVGSFLYLLPWHSCATAAQHSNYLVIENDVVVEEWTPIKGW